MTLEEIHDYIDEEITDIVEPGGINEGSQVGIPMKAVATFASEQVGCKSFVASLTQTGTDAPVVTVLKNTLGYTPTIGYVGTGNYGIAMTNLDATKTAIFISPRASAAKQLIPFTSVTGNNIFLRTYNNVTDALENDMLLNTIVKIEVYP